MIQAKVKSKRSKQHVEIVQYVHGNSLKVALPVLSQNENCIDDVDQEWGLFYAVVFESLKGEHIDIEELTDETCL